MTKYKFEIHDNFIDVEIKNKIIDLIKNENSESILSKMSKKIVLEYIDIVVKSKFLYLFTLKDDANIIAYALLSKKPKYLLSEFSQLKIKIFFDLIFKFKFITFINLLLTFMQIDILKLNKSAIKLVSENPNLNLIAVKNQFQSKGIGSLFMVNIVNYFKKIKDVEYITCETYRENAIRFYTEKCGFEVFGKKIRIFKNLIILKLKIK